MKQAAFNQKIFPAIEQKILWRKGEPTNYSKRERSQALSIYLLRLIVIAALLLGVLNSCTDPAFFPCEKAVLPEASEKRAHAGFTAIDLNMGARVLVYEGDTFEVEITAPENFLDFINSRVSGGTLKISTDRCLRSSSDAVQVKVTLPGLTNLKMSGSGSIGLVDVFSGEQLVIDLYGSGNIYGGINYKSLQSRISGSGNIEMAGKVDQHKVIISGSGQLLAYPLDTKTAEITISGSGNTFVLVREQLKVRISGSGNVFFKGNPWVQSQITGSGNLISIF